TSYTLAQAIQKVGNVDLVIAGERATDGDTAQVGPGIAAWLDLPLATYIARIDSVSPKKMKVERLVEEGYQLLEVPFPCVITVVKEIAAPRLPTLSGKKRSKTQEIPLYNAENMELDPGSLGLKGSPTKVVKIATPKVTRGGTVVPASGEAGVVDAVDQLMTFLEQKELV
ncbi:MAG: electron transfer flavoprotein subunit beta, partial [Alkalispirochaeta sp.]